METTQSKYLDHLEKSLSAVIKVKEVSLQKLHNLYKQLHKLMHNNVNIEDENITNFFKCLVKYINCVNIYSKQINKENMGLKLFCSILQDLSKQHNATTSFLYKLCNIIFKILIDPTTLVWFSKNLMFNFNILLRNFKKPLMHKCVQRNTLYMKQLLGVLFNCGDYNYQVDILETFFYMCSSKQISEFGKEFLPCSLDLQEAFIHIQMKNENRCNSIRTFLNSMNSYNDYVFSIKCECVQLDLIEVCGPQEAHENDLLPLWIDFNRESKSVSVICDAKSLDIYNNNNNNNGNTCLETVTIYVENVSVVTTSRYFDNIAIGEAICFDLTQPCSVIFPSSERVAQAKQFKFGVLCGPQQAKLIDVILPEMFEGKCTRLRSSSSPSKPRPIRVDVPTNRKVIPDDIKNYGNSQDNCSSMRPNVPQNPEENSMKNGVNYDFYSKATVTTHHFQRRVVVSTEIFASSTRLDGDASEISDDSTIDFENEEKNICFTNLNHTIIDYIDLTIDNDNEINDSEKFSVSQKYNKYIKSTNSVRSPQTSEFYTATSRNFSCLLPVNDFSPVFVENRGLAKLLQDLERVETEDDSEASIPLLDANDLNQVTTINESNDGDKINGTAPIETSQNNKINEVNLSAVFQHSLEQAPMDERILCNSSCDVNIELLNKGPNVNNQKNNQLKEKREKDIDNTILVQPGIATLEDKTTKVAQQSQIESNCFKNQQCKEDENVSIVISKDPRLRKHQIVLMNKTTTVDEIPNVESKNEMKNIYQKQCGKRYKDDKSGEKDNQQTAVGKSSSDFSSPCMDNLEARVKNSIQNQMDESSVQMQQNEGIQNVECLLGNWNAHIESQQNKQHTDGELILTHFGGGGQQINDINSKIKHFPNIERGKVQNELNKQRHIQEIPELLKDTHNNLNVSVSVIGVDQNTSIQEYQNKNTQFEKDESMKIDKPNKYLENQVEDVSNDLIEQDIVLKNTSKFEQIQNKMACSQPSEKLSCVNCKTDYSKENVTPSKVNVQNDNSKSVGNKNDIETPTDFPQHLSVGMKLEKSPVARFVDNNQIVNNNLSNQEETVDLRASRQLIVNVERLDLNKIKRFKSNLTLSSICNKNYYNSIVTNTRKIQHPKDNEMCNFVDKSITEKMNWEDINNYRKEIFVNQNETSLGTSNEEYSNTNIKSNVLASNAIIKSNPNIDEKVNKQMPQHMTVVKGLKLFNPKDLSYTAMFTAEDFDPETSIYLKHGYKEDAKIPKKRQNMNMKYRQKVTTVTANSVFSKPKIKSENKTTHTKQQKNSNFTKQKISTAEVNKQQIRDQHINYSNKAILHDNTLDKTETEDKFDKILTAEEKSERSLKSSRNAMNSTCHSSYTRISHTAGEFDALLENISHSVKNKSTYSTHSKKMISRIQRTSNIRAQKSFSGREGTLFNEREIPKIIHKHSKRSYSGDQNRSNEREIKKQKMSDAPITLNPELNAGHEPKQEDTKTLENSSEPATLENQKLNEAKITILQNIVVKKPPVESIKMKTIIEKDTLTVDKSEYETQSTENIEMIQNFLNTKTFKTGETLQTSISGCGIRQKPHQTLKPPELNVQSMIKIASPQWRSSNDIGQPKMFAAFPQQNCKDKDIMNWLKSSQQLGTSALLKKTIDIALNSQRIIIKDFLGILQETTYSEELLELYEILCKLNNNLSNYFNLI